MATGKVRTREDSLRDRLRVILNADKISPTMLFDLMMSGSAIWRQGMGLPYPYILGILEEEVNKANQKEKADV